MRRLLLPLSLGALAGLACAGTSGGTMRHCFVLDDDKTLLIIEDGTPQPSLTIVGRDGSDKVVTYGLLEEAAFVYPNGSRLHWDEDKAWWTGKSLMVGEEAKRTRCP